MSQRFFSIEDLETLPTPQWLIDGLFEINSLVMLAGPPASYKSFLVLDWVMSMAIGRKWNNKVTTPSKVLYVLGEGKASLLKRIETWLHYHNATSFDRKLLVDTFRVTFEVPQLAVKSSVDNMLSGLDAEDFTPNVVVVDTFARSFVGLDENSQKDTGLWIEQADRLRQQGFTVIFLHHTAKNTEFGLKYRGSTAIMGAMDTAFTLMKDWQNPSQTVLSCTKQKDHDEGDPLHFNRLIVRPTPHEEGSIVLVPAIRMDERFTDEAIKKEAEIEQSLKFLISDMTFESDRSRARELAKRTGITEGAAQSRIARRRGQE